MIVRPIPIIAVLVLMGAATTTTATAQTGGSFSLGAEGGTRMAPDPAVAGSLSIGLLWRFGHPETGWGWAWGLPWYGTDLERSVGGSSVDFGHLRVRPILVGYGYTRVIGRAAIIGKVLGGYAWTSIAMNPLAADAYIDRLGARSVEAGSGKTWVARPAVDVWYDLNSKFGLHFGTGYVIARPNITVKSSLGEDKRRVRADVFTLKVGLAYSVF
jgi:hypothetical protein